MKLTVFLSILMSFGLAYADTNECEFSNVSREIRLNLYNQFKSYTQIEMREGSENINFVALDPDGLEHGRARLEFTVETKKGAVIGLYEEQEDLNGPNDKIAFGVTVDSSPAIVYEYDNEGSIVRKYCQLNLSSLDGTSSRNRQWRNLKTNVRIKFEYSNDTFQKLLRAEVPLN